MMVNLDKLLTIAQAAKRTPLSEPALRGRIEKGEIKAVKIGGHVFVTGEELRAKLGKLYTE